MTYEDLRERVARGIAEKMGDALSVTQDQMIATLGITLNEDADIAIAAVIEALAQEAEGPKVTTRDMISWGTAWQMMAIWLRSKLPEVTP